MNALVQGNTIGIQDVDYSVIEEMKDKLMIATYARYGKSVVSFEEFKQALDEGLRDELYQPIREYYEFLGEINIEISDEDLYEYCM